VTRAPTTALHTSDGREVACTCRVASTPWARLRGLLGRAALPAGEALLLPRTRSVHTCGMTFPIDVVLLDADDVVVRVVEAVPPWRFVGARGGRAALELPAGTARAAGVRAGERLTLAPSARERATPAER
jgi:uncharacterized membrane protein (UPF0127 family)